MVHLTQPKERKKLLHLEKVNLKHIHCSSVAWHTQAWLTFQSGFRLPTEIPLYPAITLLADRCTRIATLLKF